MAQKAKRNAAQSSLSRDLAQLMDEINKLRQSVTFSCALDYLMTSRGITNDDMEERTGLCRDTISRYRTQSEKDPPLKTVTLLCLALHLEPELSDEMLRLRLHESSDIMALSQQRGCHHGEITAST